MLFALERIGVEAEVTDDIEKIQHADKVIFPGVGEASSAMKYLKERKLDEVIKRLQQPVFGVCLGMQLLCADSEENDTRCLGIVPVHVKRFTEPDLKIPQIGWNTIYDLRSELFEGIKKNSYVYNVHSYYAEASEYSIATCDYGMEYAAAINKNNFYGVQFHTEKSADVGERILRNFLAI